MIVATQQFQSMVEHNRRNLKSRFIKKWYYLRPLGQVTVKRILRFVVMQIKLPLLVCMVMVFCLHRLPKPKDANFITNPSCKHHRLQPRRVMEHHLIMGLPPLLRRPTCLLHKPLQRVIFYNPRTEEIKSSVRDKERRFVGRVANGVVKQVRSLANVHYYGDVFAIGVAKATLSSSTAVEDVAVDEGEVGLGSHVAKVAVDGGVVEADNEIVAVDLVAVVGFQEDATVPDDGTGGDPTISRGAAVVEIEGSLDKVNEFGHYWRMKPAATVPVAEGAAEVGEEELVLRVKDTAREPVESIAVVFAPPRGSGPGTPASDGGGEVAVEEVVDVLTHRRLAGVDGGEGKESRVEIRVRRRRRGDGNGGSAAAYAPAERYAEAEHGEEGD